MAHIALPGVRWLPVLMVISVTVAAGVPYIMAVAKDQVPPFIPFIRHSAAYPPQSGIFSIFITIGATVGTLTFTLRYVVVQHRNFRVDKKRYQRLNFSSLLMGILLNACLIYTGANPMGFRAPAKHDWIADVLIPHYAGALSLCLCFNVYVLIQAYITYMQKRTFRKNVFIHAVLGVCVIVSSWTAVIPLSSSLRDEVKSLVNDENNMLTLEHKKYSFYSTICALSEWSFTFFSLLFILSFYKDLEKVNVRLQLKPKRVVTDAVELPTLSNEDEKETTKI